MTRQDCTEVTLANGDVVIAHYEAEYAINDHGIGAYEYWGARCVDRDLQVDLEGWDTISVHKADDEDEDDILSTLSQEDKDTIESAVETHAARNCPEMESFSDERDDYHDRQDRERDYWSDNL